ncbi:hypothetical protein D3C76_87550 [compost metagenome]
MSRQSDSKVLNVLGVIAGALLASVGLELFLMPHGIIVGGITGLSALFALTTEMKLGLFLFLLNLPLLLIQRKNIDASFAFFTIFGLLIFSLGTIVLHPYPAITSDPLPSALLGGLSLGLGIGLALRFGGALDAAEKVAETFSSKKGLSPEGIMLLLNCSILIAAGFHFGFEQAVFSVTAYILAYESVKLPLRGFKFTLSVSIKSNECDRIREALALYLNRKVAIVEDPSVVSGNRGVMECKCHRWEASRMIAIIKNCDPNSEISFDV